jgi:hypothetical protein
MADLVSKKQILNRIIISTGILIAGTIIYYKFIKKPFIPPTIERLEDGRFVIVQYK